ncbi:mechanosensitive ion channel protein MscL [Paenibacillus protaetiae]|uniref:Mechanosensitive ion channel protein MscL n=1 Tax=Paenibacillus protaetiae TaxID=2509456 RepID=A0A4P6EZ65_9BACL|nr:mechanosensitive ion channel protein MscL [Paenibacillus protaetiae]QAY68166.1 mechanosensitive ion channel protein MscL [Paenibacillus protaetiae]
MIVFDVIVNGEVKETIKPLNQKLKDIYLFMQKESHGLTQKYGANIYLNRRMEYK